MPSDRPSANELLQAIDQFLQDKVAPQVDAHTRFHLKVTTNLLRLLQREWAGGATADQAELLRLQALLHSDERDLTILNATLCNSIRQGQLALDNPRLLEHLRLTTRAKLAIDNPRYLSSR